jgi:FkbM family methyltransferase
VIKKISLKRSSQVTPIQYLINYPGLWQLDEQKRADLTISCRATDYIPKVKNAGKTKILNKEHVQVMHNGLSMLLGGYHGEWMARIIEELKGHHEPQEEVAFYEVLKRIGTKGTMIELGSFWSYYSLWFNKAIKNSLNICCEPDPNNMNIGVQNVALNKAENVHFIKAGAGSTDGQLTKVVMDSDAAKKVEVPVRTVDALCREFKITKLDLLHMDIQGFEMAALEGAEEMIKQGKVRFVFVSTHHYFFSGKANTHQECLHWLKTHGAHIIASHTIAESFSGDGLIVASFDKRDIEFKIDVPLNHTDKGLFRSYEEDIALLADHFTKTT